MQLVIRNNVCLLANPLKHKGALTITNYEQSFEYKPTGTLWLLLTDFRKFPNRTYTVFVAKICH